MGCGSRTAGVWVGFVRRSAVAVVTAVVLAVVAAPGHALAGPRCSLRSTGAPCVRLAAAPSPAAPGPAASPWLDEGGSPRGFTPVVEGAPPDRRWQSLAAVGGLYVGFSTWAYFAWYHGAESLGEFEYGDKDGYFGKNTYAGGADKLGHAWANMVLGRGGSRVLRWGGWSPTTAAIVGNALSLTLFTFVEVKDGYYYKFSYGDMYANAAGALLGAALELSPTLDRLIDFRVAYWPSPEYLGLWRGEYHGTKAGNSLNIAEDYSGQTYFLGLHLGALPLPRDHVAWRALELFDVGVMFATRQYKPDAPPDTIARQYLSLGVALDLQRLADRYLGGRASTGRKIAHGMLEVLSPPYTMLPVATGKRSADGPVGEQ